MRAAAHVYHVDGWGRGELWVARGVLVHHELDLTAGNGAGAGTGAAQAPAGAPGEAPPGGASAPSGTVAEKVSRVGDGFVPGFVRRVREQLAGRPVEWGDVEVDLSWCTPFQRALAEALRGVPWGEVVSYGELAALAGRPGAARAAGSFCAENRFALVLPCHRVVAAGGIGGYGSSGVAVKRRLLALEGVEL